jgi:hypothetical protein
LGIQMQGVTSAGFLEIAQLLAEPTTAFQQLRFIDMDYNDFSHGPTEVAEALVCMLRTPGALPSLRGINTPLYTESSELYDAVKRAVEPRPSPDTPAPPAESGREYAGRCLRG